MEFQEPPAHQKTGKLNSPLPELFFYIGKSKGPLYAARRAFISGATGMTWPDRISAYPKASFLILKRAMGRASGAGAGGPAGRQGEQQVAGVRHERITVDAETLPGPHDSRRGMRGKDYSHCSQRERPPPMPAAPSPSRVVPGGAPGGCHGEWERTRRLSRCRKDQPWPA